MGSLLILIYNEGQGNKFIHNWLKTYLHLSLTGDLQYTYDSLLSTTQTTSFHELNGCKYVCGGMRPTVGNRLSYPCSGPGN